MAKKKAKTWKKIKRKLAKHLYLVRFVAFSLLIGAVIYGLVWLLPTSLKLARGFLKNTYLFSGTPEKSLISTDGRANLLLLGSGGTNHQGTDLTDTIIFFSVDLGGKGAVMISLPRDIWIPSMRAKLNTAYHYGEEKKPGGGLILAKAAVSEILAQPIHYSLMLDFDGFIKAIDLLDGVEVEVGRAFDDFKYPIPGMEEAEPEELRYEHLRFEAGSQSMDGQRALKYVRSRFAEGEEGTDFARSQRQQQLLQAITKKVFSTESLLKPQRVPELVKIFADHVETDIGQEEYLPFLKLALMFEKTGIKSEVLNGGGEGKTGFLINPGKSKQYDFQWVLVPQTGDWLEVQKYVARLVTEE